MGRMNRRTAILLAAAFLTVVGGVLFVKGILLDVGGHADMVGMVMLILGTSIFVAEAFG